MIKSQNRRALVFSSTYATSTIQNIWMITPIELLIVMIHDPWSEKIDKETSTIVR